MRADANVVVGAIRVRFLEGNGNCLDPGLARPGLRITRENSALAPVHNLLQVDAVDVSILVLIVRKKLVKVCEIGRQTKVAVDRCHLQLAFLGGFIFLRGSYHVDDTAELVIQHVHA